MDNAVLQNMRSRRSCRAYQDRQISQEQLDAVLEAGLWAPNGMARQATKFVAIQDKEIIRRLSGMNAEIQGKPGTDPFYGAPTVIVVLSQADVPTAVEDGAEAICNMLNAAASLELGGCWIHRARQEFDSAEGKQLLADWGLEGDYVGVGHCILGYPKTQPGEGAPRKEGRIIKVL